MNNRYRVFPVFVFFALLFIVFSGSVQAGELFDISYDSSTKTVNISTSKNIKPEVLNIDSPPRMVIDFPEAVYRPGSKRLDINDGNIKQIRVSQYRSNPPVARVSIELIKNIDFEVRASNEGDRQNIQVSALNSGNTSITINNTSLNKYNKPKKIVKNSVEAIEYKGNRIIISGKNKIRSEISKTSQPNVYSLKLADFSMNGLKNIPVKEGQEIEDIKVEERNNYSLFTFKLKQNFKLATRNIEFNKLEVYLTEIAQPTDNPRTNIVSDNPISLDFTDNEQTSRVFISSAKKTFKYRLFELSNPDRVVIDTFDTVITGFEDPFTNKFSKYIQKVRYGYLDSTQGPGVGVRIVIELKKKLHVKENTLTEKRLELLLYEDEKDNSYTPRGEHKILVVLDPGHGGNDPGAIGPNGAREKDVTLAVSYYVRQMLIDNGIGVAMARGDDSEILLQPRVDVANNNRADLFVSVHCNAMDGPSPTGIETYYRTPQSATLAKIMHRNMIANLPVNDRGIRVRNFFVIHHTVMPSVLIEIGYITNAQEGEALATSSYQKRVASAIFKGIKDYLNSQIKI